MSGNGQSTGDTYVYWSYNDVTVDMYSGTNTADIDWTVDVGSVVAAGEAVPYYYMTNCDVAITGLGGMDTVHVNYTGSAHGTGTWVEAFASVSSNTVTLMLGDGTNDTTIGFSHDASAVATSGVATAWVNLTSNAFEVNYGAEGGGSGADTLVLDVVGTVDGTGPSADVWVSAADNSVFADLGSGLNAFDIAVRGTATATGTDGFANAYAQIYNNGIELTGGSGADTVHATLAVAASAMSPSLYEGLGGDAAVEATMSNNVVTIDVAGGTNEVYVNISATATDTVMYSGAIALARAINGTVDITGGTGSDHVEVGIHVSALASGGGEANSTADAIVSGNQITITTGTGLDTIVVDISAQATAGDATALVANNTLSLSGDQIEVGADDISVTIAAATISTNTISLTGASGADTLAVAVDGATINSNTVTLTGGGGNDHLSFTLDGAAGGSHNTVALYGGAGDDFLTLLGSGWNGTGTGTDNSIILYGEAGNDHLTGGTADDDVLIGGTGDDTLDGGAGTGDYASYEDATSGVTVNLSVSGVDVGGGMGADSFIRIEGLIGSDYVDSLTGDDNDNYLYGGAGNDFLYGGGGKRRGRLFLGVDRRRRQSGVGVRRRRLIEPRYAEQHRKRHRIAP